MNDSDLPDDFDPYMPDDDVDCTCSDCEDKEDCDFAWEPYNTNGDCLAMK